MKRELGILTRGQHGLRYVSFAILGVVLLGLYAPLGIMTALSFQEYSTAVFPPGHFTTISYHKLVSPDNFALFRIPGEPIVDYWPPLKLSLGVGLLVAVLSTSIGLMAALAFRRSFRGKAAMFYFLMLGMLIPGIAGGLGLRLLSDELDISARWYTTGVASHVAWTAPFCFVVFLIFLQRFDRDLEEAAATLGARPRRVLLTITLPILRPAVLASLLFAFTLSFDESQRSFLAFGPDQTLPNALASVTTIRITPVVYALGALIVGISLAVVTVYVAAFERERSRVYSQPEVADREGV
jgi:putative spermidine/putrescine transport system permease protein